MLALQNELTVSRGGRWLCGKLTRPRRYNYEVLYDECGVLDGARRYTDRELILRWQQFIAGLYTAGEALADYFTRRVASLPPPVVSQAT